MAERLFGLICAAVMTTLSLTSAPLAQTQENEAAPTVLITGSNRGLGFHFSKQFAEAGWNVIATTRHPETADALKELRAEHPNVAIEDLDITDDSDIEALAEKYRDQPIDVLLNNAARLGELSRQNFGSIDYELFREIFEVNVIGTMKVTEAFIQHVAASDQKKIINMGTAAGSIERGHQSGNLYAYRSTKAALHFATRHVAFEHKDQGIIVIIMEPGFADSKGLMTMNLEDAPDQETREMAERLQSLMRLARVENPDAAMLDPAVSVADMIQVIADITIDNTGDFLLHDGTHIPF